MASISQRSNGAWRARIRHKGHPAQTKEFGSEKEAIEWAQGVEVDMRRGMHLDTRKAEKTTIRTLLEEYRDNNAGDNKGEAVDKIRLQVLLDSELANLTLKTISPIKIENWYKARQKSTGNKGSTINRYLNLLSAAINEGIRRLEIPNAENPVSKVKRPANPEHRDRRLHAEEEQYLLSACTVTERDGGKYTGPSNIWLKPVVEFALETGMRRSEIMALEWKYVDLKRGVAHLPDTKISRGDDALVSRDVPLTARAIAVLEALPRDIGGRVFATTADSVKKGFERAVKRARAAYEADCKAAKEVPLARMLTDLHFHDLRHEATSRLAKIYDIKQLAKVGGWRDLNTLGRYYNPTTDELVSQLRKAGH